MKRFLPLAIVFLAAADLFAVRHVVFEADAYNRAFPLDRKDTLVFSPVSAEIGCILAAESLETIPRANVAESMGVLVEFSGVYVPVLERLAVRTNGFSFVSARGFCLPDLAHCRSDYCQQIQRDYGAAVMPLMPVKGVESWFRASMDGEMEDFSVPVTAETADRYSFYDLVSVRAEWLEPFPTSNVRRLKFAAADGKSVPLDFMSDVRVADSWDEHDYAVLKLPLRDGCFFYALLPNDGVDLALVREDFSSMEIESFLTRTGEAPVGNFHREPTVIALPRLSIDCRTDMTSALQSFRLPTSSLNRLCNGVAAREFVQRVVFRLTECGPGETCGEKPLDRQIAVKDATRRMILNRPFHFFVFDGKTKTIPVAGQFTGVATGTKVEANKKKDKKS